MPKAKVLKLFVSAEAKHLFTTAGGIASAEAFVNGNVEQLFELRNWSLFWKGRLPILQSPNPEDDERTHFFFA